MGIEDQIQELFVSNRKNYERIMRNDLNSVFAGGDAKSIIEYSKRLDKLHEWVANRFGIGAKPATYKEKTDRISEERQNLMKVLEQYELGQVVQEDELTKKTGLTIKQLTAYANPRNPNRLITKTSEGNYEIRRVLKKNSTEEPTLIEQA